MPYALNAKKGTTINHPSGVELPGGIAVPVTDKQANMLKHFLGVIVFKSVAGVNEEKAVKNLYGVDKSIIENTQEEAKTYKDFMIKYKDPKIASQKWSEYKQEKGMN